MSRRKQQPKKRTKAQRLAFLKKQLVWMNSELRVTHEKIVELRERIVHTERLREETQRAVDELEQ